MNSSGSCFSPIKDTLHQSLDTSFTQLFYRHSYWFMGVGGGFIAFPLLIYVLGVPTLVAVGTSAFQILFSTGYGAFRHASLGHVELTLVGLLLIGSMLGVQLGVYVTKFLGGHKIRQYFAYVIGLGVLVIFGDFIRELFF